MQPKYKRVLQDKRPDLYNAIIKYNENRENLLSKFATKNNDGIRREQNFTEDIRTKFSRDADRIIHSKAYSRYIDKTQVFFMVDNDHITHRVLHIQLVSKIARTIGRSLRLNEDLIEAIAVGHDIGHPPFGHQGEEILSDLCKKNRSGRFLHNVEGVKFLEDIENCNLTLQVLDGILCHNGEKIERSLRPDRKKDWKIFDNEIKEILKGRTNYAPMTLEGCVVRMADIIAYLGRDIQDARIIGLIKRDDLNLISEECTGKIGTENADIVNNLIIDIIENSFDKEDEISYSKEIYECLKKYKNFNYNKIYNNPKRLGEKSKIVEMYGTLFEKFLNDLKRENKDSKIYEHFVEINKINREYVENYSYVEIVRDYIAGMTDRYFEDAFKDVVLPKRVKTFKEKEI
ncbi:DGTP triphosphohydrolase [groundwater metagenome]|uniref:dGTP triphosphohydrolase n=1 Tax=groundwater metagenome TaxID=717931 RepID=A0A098E873_9ZZZZ